MPQNLGCPMVNKTIFGFFLRFENNKFAMAEHTGSHIDVPAHFVKGGKRVDKVPMHTLIGPGVKIDVTEKTKNNPDYQITVGKSK